MDVSPGVAPRTSSCPDCYYCPECADTVVTVAVQTEVEEDEVDIFEGMQTTAV